MAKLNEIRQMSEEEILVQIEDLRKDLFALGNVAQMAKKNERPHLKKAMRKEISRCHTVLSEKRMRAEGDVHD